MGDESLIETYERIRKDEFVTKKREMNEREGMEKGRAEVACEETLSPVRKIEISHLKLTFFKRDIRFKKRSTL